ncbi:MAG: type II secretion system F family protein [Candidatus Paceibacterota bacterium]|jgi:type IV pilus assembly protein PilC
MLFNYKALDNKTGQESTGGIDAVTVDVAISSLQNRGLTISEIHPAEEKGSLLAMGSMKFFERVNNRDIVILSRQIATLFGAQISALRVFKLLSAEVENHVLSEALSDVANDIQGGSTISRALGKHPKIFSEFYVNMVKSGEESGKLDQTFLYLAEYLDRSYEISSKARNALIYPAFVVVTFIVVMILMLTMVIPKVSAILKESGQALPIYTQIVLGISNFFVDYGFLLLILLAIGGIFLWRYGRTPAGKLAFASVKISIPALKNLYIKLYLSRIADNMNTMLTSGISMIRALELTGAVVDNEVYRQILNEASVAVKGGSSVSDALSKHEEIPGIMVAMIKIGEETGELGSILKTLATFYIREVNNAVDTLVGLIEPTMVVALGLGVGVLLSSVLIPIYNISSSF